MRVRNGRPGSVTCKRLGLGPVQHIVTTALHVDPNVLPSAPGQLRGRAKLWKSDLLTLSGINNVLFPYRFYTPSTDTMQFTAAFLALAAFAVSQVSANASIVRQFNALGSTDQGALHTCLQNYRTDNWDGMDCGGRGWFKGSHDYKSPENCWDACAGLLVQAIDQGASDVECDDNEGGAKCWLGFH
ncbi:hypothetical protein VTO73DRAFT_4431 [Trametes versicolor]